MSNILSKPSANKYEPLSWQGRLEEMLITSKPGCRDIYWFYTENKTSEIYDFINYMCEKHNAIIAPASTTSMKFVIANFISVNGTEPKIILLDALSNMAFKTVNYPCIEDVKKGYFHLSHGNIRTVFIESPHVVVFAFLKPLPNSGWEDICQIIYLE